jgi:hypothetical protein
MGGQPLGSGVVLAGDALGAAIDAEAAGHKQSFLNVRFASDSDTKADIV